MSAIPTNFPETINEGSTARYEAALFDETGAAIPASLITALTLTMVQAATGAIINGRNVQNVLNANQVTVDAAGMLRYDLQPADTAMLDPTQGAEFHRATFRCTFGVTGQANWDVDFRIRNLAQVP